MPATDAAVEALRKSCDDVAEASGRDAVDGVAPSVVVRPGSTEETAEALRAAAEHGLAIVARGHGSKLSWGRPPERLDAVLDMSRLDRVVDHAAGDLVAVVQAGTPLAALQQVLAPAGQRLALDETVPGATLGGAVATATSGPLRVSAGTLRDLLLGVTLVRADGVVAVAGGRVVKNVAGYDLGKLVTGSYGTLAVLTEAVVRLHPVPAARRVVAVTASDARQAHAMVSAVVHSPVVAAAVEIDVPAGGAPTVAVLLEGTSGGVAGRTQVVRRLLADAGATDVADTDAPPPWWGTLPFGPGDVGLKLTCALSGVGELLDACAGPGREHGMTVRGSAGSGVLHAALPGTTAPAAVATAVEHLRGTCTRLGGSLVVVDAPTETKAAVDVWGPVPAIDLMRRVKDQFDPEHRLAPGRFVGGI